MLKSEYRIEVRRHASRAPSFSWLLFFGADTQPVQSSQRVFASEAAARAVGEQALTEFLRLTDYG
jgi:hypothetical protein